MSDRRALGRDHREAHEEHEGEKTIAERKSLASLVRWSDTAVINRSRGSPGSKNRAAAQCRERGIGSGGRMARASNCSDCGGHYRPGYGRRRVGQRRGAVIALDDTFGRFGQGGRRRHASRRPGCHRVRTGRHSFALLIATIQRAYSQSRAEGCSPIADRQACTIIRHGDERLSPSERGVKLSSLASDRRAGACLAVKTCCALPADRALGTWVAHMIPKGAMPPARKV